MRAMVLTMSLGLLALCGKSAAQDTVDPQGEALLAKMLDGYVAGEPVRCLTRFRLQNADIVDGTAVVFRVGGTYYVNRPQIGAETLDERDILVSLPRPLSALCKDDEFDVVDRGSGAPSGLVRLDAFVPYERAKPTP